MASSKRRRGYASSTFGTDDDDGFPDIDALVSSKELQAQAVTDKAQKQPKERSSTEEAAKPATTIRRRKLGPLTDNLLLKAWTPDSAESAGVKKHAGRGREKSEPRRTRVELRTRNTKLAVVIPSSPADLDDEYVSAQEEASIIEDVSMFDDTFHSCGSEGSSLENNGHEDDEDGEDIFGPDIPPKRSPVKPRLPPKDRVQRGRRSRETSSEVQSMLGTEEDGPSQPKLSRTSSGLQGPRSNLSTGRGRELNAKETDKGFAETLSKLRLDETEEKPGRAKDTKPENGAATPPSTPPKSRPGLVSPRKLPRIPVTPHRPSSDMFWSQEFVDEWNEEHSPRKQLFPDAAAARQRSPTKSNPEKKPQKTPGAKKPSEREAKKAFEKIKHELAQAFLQELDETITNGKLTELAASTGGIRLMWTNKLNTTAGRANWKRETIRSTARPADNPSSSSSYSSSPFITTTSTTTAPKYRHHASIELAEKVIDDEHRLLNVLAHEFCHLANFMISGVTSNPHGAQFKAWAAQVSRAFGASRGVQVTTKHSYDIDFKYVWQCVACKMEFKRHSRSIDPARHRCGSCRSELVQTKPVPRKKKKEDGEGGGGTGKVSEYQAFVKEQMRVVKAENPKSPQKEIMKIVASRWAAKKDKAATLDGGMQAVEEGMRELAV
ncbi:hypothetical protein N657DRAFT_663574 [Parathielavia appendiculata]|uniref:SprT-like domain-containing protein n=1 Tax=Parathielavia appendiculata TaxID=2587402 RepID=A0AAN6U1E2_9PEZI|nr:hypothetical protein N657DRAFT_663574 [Parathielavia appendiculata]